MAIKSIGYSFVRIIIFISFFSFILFWITSCDSKIDKSSQNKINSKLPIINIGRLICGGHLPLAVVGEDYTGAQANVFEKVLTTPPDWISYTNMSPMKRT